MGKEGENNMKGSGLDRCGQQTHFGDGLVAKPYLTLATPCTSVHGFPRQEHWSGQPFPSPGDIPEPGIEPGSPALQAESLLTELPRKHMA